MVLSRSEIPLSAAGQIKDKTVVFLAKHSANKKNIFSGGEEDGHLEHMEYSLAASCSSPWRSPWPDEARQTPGNQQWKIFSNDSTLSYKDKSRIIFSKLSSKYSIGNHQISSWNKSVLYCIKYYRDGVISIFCSLTPQFHNSMKNSLNVKSGTCFKLQKMLKLWPCHYNYAVIFLCLH